VHVVSANAVTVPPEKTKKTTTKVLGDFEKHFRIKVAR